MYIENVDLKINKAVEVIGSLSSYFFEVVSGNFDEEISCLIFKNEFKSNPVTVNDITAHSVVSKIVKLKNDISLKLESIEQANAKLENDKIFDSFRYMNKKSRLGSISDISKHTGLSKSVLRKAKKDGNFLDVVLKYYPSYVKTSECAAVVAKIDSCLKDKLHIASLIGVIDIDSEEFQTFVEDLSYSTYREADVVSINVNMFNKYKNRILNLN